MYLSFSDSSSPVSYTHLDVYKRQLLEKMTCNPAFLYKLPGGVIQVNAPADFVIFDPDEKWTGTDFAAKASNSPFKGYELYGKIHYTICTGKIVYEG